MVILGMNTVHTSMSEYIQGVRFKFPDAPGPSESDGHGAAAERLMISGPPIIVLVPDIVPDIGDEMSDIGVQASFGSTSTPGRARSAGALTVTPGRARYRRSECRARRMILVSDSECHAR